MRRFLAFLVCLCLSVLAWPCLWDNDTLAAEAKGLPTVLDAIVGRIPVNPPEYYKRRIEISEAAIKANPGKLEAYDNLAVAHDKLGDFEKAMKAMVAKKAQMAKMTLKTTDHEYRYHANVGTIFAHEWVRQQPNGEPAMLELAIAEIAKAIEINPDAHFGRENIQLRLLESLAQHTGVREKGEMHDWQSWSNYAEESGREKVVEGVIAIMALGGNYESRDLVALLSATAGPNDGHLALVAEYRDAELKSSGKSRWIEQPVPGASMVEDKRPVRRDYQNLRADAAAFQKEYTDFVTQQLALGRHPDTHRDFWKGYTERPRLVLQENRPFVKARYVPYVATVASIILAVIGFWIFQRLRLSRSGR